MSPALRGGPVTSIHMRPSGAQATVWLNGRAVEKEGGKMANCCM